MDEESRSQGLPSWAIKVVGSVSVALLGGFIGWMTYVSGQLNEATSNHGQMKVQVQEIERRVDSLKDDGNKRYDEMRRDFKEKFDRLEQKIDRLIENGLGAKGISGSKGA